MKTTELTEANKAAAPKYVDKWVNVGLNTDRFTLDEAIDIIHPVQELLLNMPKTAVLVVDNPSQAWIACHLAKAGVPLNEIMQGINDFIDGKNRFKLEAFCSPFLSGSFSVPNFSFYDFMFSEVGVEVDSTLMEKYKAWEATTKLGMIFPLEKVCIVSQKPIKISRNAQGQIHADCDGPAIEYAGRLGERVFALNGTIVPEEIATTPSGKLTLKMYNSLKSADVKMEFVRKFGIERMLSYGKKIDSFEKYPDNEWYQKSQYEIWDMKALFPGVDYAPHLKMQNQTTGVWHVEALPPDVRTIEQAMFRRMNNRNIKIEAIA